MKVEKKDLEKSQIELNAELSQDEFKPFINKAAKRISKEVKIDGFRSGNIPYEILKQKIGEMTILEEAARIAISSKLEELIKDHVDGDPVGQPKVDITKLAPENSLEFKVVLALLPEVTLGKYKDLKIKVLKAEVADEDIKKALDEILEMRTKEALVEREVKEGDKVLADLRMFLDNVPIEGGQSKDTVVIMGKNYVVLGFDKHLLGAKKGDVKEFGLPYPKDHHMKNLAGKMVDFKVTIKDVYERIKPELNDDLAKGFGLKSADELKENIKKSIKEQKKKDVDMRAEKEMLESIIAKTKFSDIAEMLVKHEGDKMLAELEQTIAQQGGKFEDYLQSIKKSREQLTLDLLPDAVKRVKTSMMIREVAKREKIKVVDEELNKQIEDMKKHYKGAGSSSPDAKQALAQVNTPEYKSYVYNILSSRKVVDKLKEWNIIN
ncbi:trigger factor [Candidatus Parcubacteria bacterium]|nr:trigger factor [Candidatus Parcubacteria bacterium]